MTLSLYVILAAIAFGLACAVVAAILLLCGAYLWHRSVTAGDLRFAFFAAAVMGVAAWALMHMNALVERAQ